MKKFLALLLTGALVLGALSACGNTGSGADTKSPSAETPPAQLSNETEDTGIVYPVEIENDWGDGVTVIETEPNAIAVFDVGMLDILDTLGFGDRVVAVTHGVVIPDYLSEYEGDRYVSLGGFKDWDEEALSNSNPDLIFAGFRQTKGIEAVDAVAPAIYFGEDDEANKCQNPRVDGNRKSRPSSLESGRCWLLLWRTCWTSLLWETQTP